MADRKFAGLCIAGPYAGRMIVQDRQTFQVEERQPLKTLLELSVSDTPPPEMLIEQHTYRWTSIGPFALWIHESTDLNHALDAMAQAYQEKHRVA